MSPLDIEKRTRVEQVHDGLRDLITSPGMAVGDRLLPVRALATRFGTSVPTVQRAVAQLAAEGLLDCRQGSGIYVASPHAPLGLEHSVALCMEAGADVFGELATRLLDGVQESGCFATLVDTSSAAADQLLHRMSHTNASCLVIHGHGHFPFDMLTDPSFRRKPIIGVIDWDTRLDIPDLHRVLSDIPAGASLVVDHLWQLGHRRLLIAGTGTQIYALTKYPRPGSHLGAAIAAGWRERGGQVALITSQAGGDEFDRFDEDELLAHFSGPEPPTAIVGLRDLEAHLAQRIFRRRRPDLVSRVAMVGYYDTPWSLASDPCLTSVSLDLPELARATLAVLEPILAGRSVAPVTVKVSPRLIVRDTSVPVPTAG